MANLIEAKNRKDSYTCRFCGMIFTKSQSLGGHMNGHRQEREAEKVRQAEELLQKRGNSSLPQPMNKESGALQKCPAQLQSGGQGNYGTFSLNSMGQHPPQNFGYPPATQNFRQHALPSAAQNCVNYVNTGALDAIYACQNHWNPKSFQTRGQEGAGRTAVPLQHMPPAVQQTSQFSAPNPHPYQRHHAAQQQTLQFSAPNPNPHHYELHHIQYKGLPSQPQNAGTQSIPPNYGSSTADTKPKPKGRTE